MRIKSPVSQAALFWAPTRASAATFDCTHKMRIAAILFPLLLPVSVISEKEEEEVDGTVASTTVMIVLTAMVVMSVL